MHQVLTFISDIEQFLTVNKACQPKFIKYKLNCDEHVGIKSAV